MSDWPFAAAGTDPTAPPAGLRLLLPAEPISVRRARREVAAACVELPPELHDTVQLLVSELVTNAVVHPRGPGSGVGPHMVGLECRRSPGVLHVAVSDHDPAPPAPRRPAGPAEGGWGMHLLTALAQQSGVRLLPGGRGKTVWFELHLPGTPGQPGTG